MNGDNRPNLLHLHAQQEWHQPAFILGNKAGLLALRNTIDTAIQQGSSHALTMTRDGEKFDLYVLMDDTDWQSESWRKAAVPYTEDAAVEQREEAVWPWDRKDLLGSNPTFFS
ncbi:hypothetical protein D2Q93_04340 [Alicyclobacillaceae bacterium I2511]|nr:hypothetical protein D2Q93_04340 [Alicyclobacillaceae bacterium I2511]